MVDGLLNFCSRFQAFCHPIRSDYFYTFFSLDSSFIFSLGINTKDIMKLKQLKNKKTHVMMCYRLVQGVSSFHSQDEFISNFTFLMGKYEQYKNVLVKYNSRFKSLLFV